ncbi:MAG: hypothetical protein ACLUNZ_08985 [Evtepia sp.]
MHMGNARGGVLGDTLASVLQKSGADVWREFYVNDAGNQIEKFAKSLEARYFQIIKGEDAVEFPEDGYHGDDIRELAQAFYEREGEKYLECDEKTRHDALAQFGLRRQHPQDEGRSGPVRHSVRPVVLRVLPSRQRLCGRHRGGADRQGLYLREGRRAVAEDLRYPGRPAAAGGQERRGYRKAGLEGRRAVPRQRVLYLLCRRHRLSPQQIRRPRL